MKILDVGVNPSKSLISLSGEYAEFAKRFVSANMDLSPWSLKEYGSIFSNWAILLQNVRKRSIDLVPFLKILGFGSRAVGHITQRSVIKFWTNQTVFKVLWSTCRLSSRDLFRGLYSQLDYWTYPMLNAYSRWHKTTTSLWKGLLEPIQESLNKHHIPTHFNVMSTVELRAVKQLATHWLRDLLSFSTTNKVEKITYKGLIQHELIGQVEDFISKVFWGSPFYEYLCWGRRGDWFKKGDNIPIMHAWQINIEDLLKVYYDNPKTWLVNTDWKVKACPQTVDHMFKSLPSEDLKLHVVREMKDLCKSMNLYQKALDIRLNDVKSFSFFTAKTSAQGNFTKVVRSKSGINLPVKGDMYYHPFLNKWIPISSITKR
jgi:hypothetical protein